MLNMVNPIEGDSSLSSSSVGEGGISDDHRGGRFTWSLTGRAEL